MKKQASKIANTAQNTSLTEPHEARHASLRERRESASNLHARRNALGMFSMAALAGAGAAMSAGSAQALGAAAGTYYDVKTYGAKGDGANDDTAAIQAAINAAKLTGGTVFFPLGRYRCNGTLNAVDAKGVILQGTSASKPTTGTYYATTLEYAGTAEPFLDANNCRGFQMSNLFITPINAAFTGRVVSFDAPEGKQSTHVLIDNCTITGNNESFNAGVLVALNATIRVSIRNCNFEYAKVAVRGVLPLYTGNTRNNGLSQGAFSNVINIENSNFIVLTECAIKNAGESWLVSSCAFEYLKNGRAGAYTHDRLPDGRGVGAQGTTFIGCWFGDANNEPAVWIDYCGLGLSLVGNMIGGPKCVVFNSRPMYGYTDVRSVRRNAGFSATGNHFSYASTVFDLGSGPTALGGNVMIAGNSFVGIEKVLVGTLPPNAIAQIETEAFIQSP
ncbi:MAG: glycosyl hydrolase family 28-related protein [Casimicrobium sp.]